MKYTYYNLTQCEEKDGDRMVYLRSTDVEQAHYRRLLWSVPDEWLYLLVKGHQIEVIDKSSNSQGKIERIFIPVLNDVINYLSHGAEFQARTLQPHFVSALGTLQDDTLLFTKYKFWTKRLRWPIKIEAKTIFVEKESNPLEKEKSKNKKADQYILLTEWNKYHSYPPLGTLRMLVFNEKQNGFSKVIRRVGRRVLISEPDFFAWLDKQKA